MSFRIPDLAGEKSYSSVIPAKAGIHNYQEFKISRPCRTGPRNDIKDNLI